ncbi:hypothetical protein HZS_1005 [Henneguya salminicola]|nr:hypothetical protein HZS_1005 [Henneguya salminicola]
MKYFFVLFQVVEPFGLFKGQSFMMMRREVRLNTHRLFYISIYLISGSCFKKGVSLTDYSYLNMKSV